MNKTCNKCGSPKQLGDFPNWGRADSTNRCWNIDHISPLSSATSEEDLLKLVHYTNLQPLWAVENIKKGGAK